MVNRVRFASSIVRMVSIPDCLQRISDVLQLMGQLSPSGPPPASQATIGSLPTSSIKQSDVGKYNIWSVLSLQISK